MKDKKGHDPTFPVKGLGYQRSHQPLVLKASLLTDSKAYRVGFGENSELNAGIHYLPRSIKVNREAETT